MLHSIHSKSRKREVAAPLLFLGLQMPSMIRLCKLFNLKVYSLDVTLTFKMPFCRHEGFCYVLKYKKWHLISCLLYQHTSINSEIN